MVTSRLLAPVRNKLQALAAIRLGASLLPSPGVLQPIRGALGTLLWSALLCFALLFSPSGCGSPSNDATTEQDDPVQQQGEPGTAGITTRDRLDSRPNGNQREMASASDETEIQTESLFPTENTSAQGANAANRNLGNLLSQADRSLAAIQPTPIDDEAAQALGIQKLSGTYLDLYTDVRDPVVHEYLAAFEQAVEQWADYFDVPVPTADEFHIRGCFMEDRRRFERAGLLPADLPPFPFGYQRDAELWAYPQPGPYYSRHLILHEGTHAFMRLVVGGCGPPWYMEGMAELLATHHWDGETVQLRYTIRDRDEAPYWGRVKIIRDAYQENRALTLEQIMQYGWHAHLEVEPYGWCWAACTFFDNHPQYQEAFRALSKVADDRSISFSEGFMNQLGDQWPQAREQWELFVAEMDYGYDVNRAAIVYREPRPLGNSGTTVTIAADQGWQSTGLRIEADQEYHLTASGQFQVGNSSAPWRCEPNGITLEYFQGLPLGMLTAAIRPDNPEPTQITPLARPLAIGNDFVLKPSTTGTLFVRINESPVGLHDNAGEIQMRIEPQ